MIELRTGDLFQAPDTDAFAHGCNCAGAMGRGIAVQFRTRWPAMYEVYRLACAKGRLRPGEVLPWRTPGCRWIYNLGTQAHWKVGATLDAIEQSVGAMLQHAESTGVRTIAMPRIGAGLGGLKWPDVHECIERTAQSSTVQLIVYALDEPTE